MKKSFYLLILTPFLLSSCFSYVPAMSESSYQHTVDVVKQKLLDDGFNLTGNGISGGYHDTETYKFSNSDGGEVEFKLMVHRGDNNGQVFIDEVEVVGCNTVNYSDPKFCEQESGTLEKLISENINNDIKGRKFSVGKTVGAIVGGSVGLGVLFGVIMVIAAL
ncbi:MAG: hypothetical protein II975_03995 [Bacteroidales bacterium]|nr:hypothetical protein [Bacteroidales bacterium]